MDTAPRLTIGLTGGIGSGKSTVAAVLVEHGAALIDADAIARELTLPGGRAIPAITAAFGPGFIGADGALDRTRMRALAFADRGARLRLEAILHPLIAHETAARAAASTAAVVVHDIPLLVESGRWRQRLDRVLVVDCAEATQIARVVRRSGLEAGAVQAVIAQQATRAARRAAADAVLYNDGISLAQLSAQTLAILRRWLRGRVDGAAAAPAIRR